MPLTTQTIPYDYGVCVGLILLQQQPTVIHGQCQAGDGNDMVQDRSLLFIRGTKAQNPTGCVQATEHAESSSLDPNTGASARS